MAASGSPTTKVAIQIPQGITAATPTINPNWSVTKVMKDLKDPITDSEGDKLTERVDQVVYTAKTPLPDGYRDTLAIQLKLPDDAAGQTLVFPTVQTCQQGETAWIQVPAKGQNPEELDAPAPSLKVTAAADEEGNTTTESASAGVKSPDNTTGIALGVAGLVACLVGLAAGTTALILRNKRA